jgi:anti-sigma factor RsiW
MKKCNRYTTEMLSQFVDNALPPETRTELARHLTTCPTCRHTVKRYQSITSKVMQNIQRHGSRANNTALEQNLLVKIRKEKAMKASNLSFFQGVINFIKGKKIYLQMASFAAILLMSMAFLQDQKVVFQTPSAIVNSIDGEMASVMILETREQRHTIIWYKET